jgi:hypothetical protein
MEKSERVKMLVKQSSGADRVQMEKSERVKMLEKQSSEAGCVNPSERNLLWRLGAFPPRQTVPLGPPMVQRPQSWPYPALMRP